MNYPRRTTVAAAFALTCVLAFGNSWAQDSDSTDTSSDDPDVSAVEVASRVEVIPENSDIRIEQRLSDIMDTMKAHGLFESVSVNVDEGIVFLTGTTDTEEKRERAERIAMRTHDVVAVVNQIQLAERPLFDIEPARNSLRDMTRELVTGAPLFVVAFVVVVVFFFLARVAAAFARVVFTRKKDSKLLRHLIGTVIGVLVFLIGVYIALRVSGLTRLATTLLGGTGLIGLAIGFAFRDIAENFLSSVLLSLQHPFIVGDLIEVDGTTGFVRRVTIRATILATFEGNQVQIPNSTIYKAKITNYTATPLCRMDFQIGIGYADSAQEAQKIVMDILTSHPAVIVEPEPMVLVDSLGCSAVYLKCLFWFNQKTHSGVRVKSAVIRQSKQALMNAGITIPDEAREILFPTNVPVQLMPEDPVGVQATAPTPETTQQVDEPTESEGEGNLHSDEEDLIAVLGETDSDADDNILEPREE